MKQLPLSCDFFQARCAASPSCSPCFAAVQADLIGGFMSEACNATRHIGWVRCVSSDQPSTPPQPPLTVPSLLWRGVARLDARSCAVARQEGRFRGCLCCSSFEGSLFLDLDGVLQRLSHCISHRFCCLVYFVQVRRVVHLPGVRHVPEPVAMSRLERFLHEQPRRRLP